MAPVPEPPDRPFTYDELPALGLTRSWLRRGVREGRVRRVLTSVYVAASLEDSMDLRLDAAARVISPGHVACDRTAAWLHGVDVRTFAEHVVLPPLETCVFRGHVPTERTDLLGRTRDLLPRDVVDLGPIRATSALRTALDLGCNLTRSDALATMDQLRRMHGIEVRALQSELPRFRRRRGVIQLRELIPLSDPRAESPRESWTRLALVDAGLPLPESQWWIEIDGRPTYRLDLAYPRHRVAIEYDGEEFHRSREQAEADRLRRDWLREDGWTVIVVRKGDFTGGRLADWGGRGRRALASQPSNLRW